MPQDAGLIEPPQRSQVEQHRSIPAAGQAEPDPILQLTFNLVRWRISGEPADGRTGVNWSIGRIARHEIQRHSTEAAMTEGLGGLNRQTELSAGVSANSFGLQQITSTILDLLADKQFIDS